MQNKIQQKLRHLEKEHGFRVLYACESGSRAWGFASADSDYDVRFIYVWPRDRYLEIYPPTDAIDLAIDSDDLDLSGWDIRKTLPLFRKSNGPLFEWLFSPIIYLEEKDVMSHWRVLAADYFVPGHSVSHYLGLSKKIYGAIEESGQATAKKYLYVLRALLSADYVVSNHRPPPVAFGDLCKPLDLPPVLQREIETMIAEKAGGSEGDQISRNEILERFIHEKTPTLKESASTLNREPRPVEPLDQFFQSVIA